MKDRRMDTPPDREALAAHPIEALFRRHWSPRSFTAAPVAQAALESVLEAARETAPRQRRPIGEFAFFGGWQG
jgi:hypothetical protein